MPPVAFASRAEAPGAGPIACAGGFAAARAEPALGRDDGVAVEGTSGLRSRLRRPGRVLIVDAARRVVGFAHTGFGDGRWTGLPNWQTRETTEADLERWAEMGAGVGLVNDGGLIVVDIDARDEGTANEIEAEAIKTQADGLAMYLFKMEDVTDILDRAAREGANLHGNDAQVPLE